MKIEKLLPLLLLFLPLGAWAADKADEKDTSSQKDEKGYVDMKKLAGTLRERITLNGYLQAGFDYNDAAHPKDQFKVNRVIAYATGQVTRDLSARVMFDVKNATLFEAWANYRLSPALQIKMGQYKTPFSIENPLSPTVLETIGCTSLVTGYMIGGSSALTMPGAGGRDVGLSVYGSLFKGVVDYNLSVMNGQGRNKSDANSQKDFVARLDIKPVKGLLLSGSMIRGTGNVAVTRADDGKHYTSPVGEIGGLKANGNFRRDRYAVGVGLTTRPVNLRTEYMAGIEGRSHSRGYYATGVLNRVVGNLDIVASYDWLDVFTGPERRYTGGVQYWFYPKCRAQLGYAYKEKNDHSHENLLQAQLQIAF